MSPAQAVVPVDRYIGSCLISSVGYKKDRYRYPCIPEYYAPSWGVPIVAPPGARRPKKDKEERSPLSRLAIHTQGAPLIQAQRQSNRKSNKPPVKQAPQPQQAQEESPNENSLPRIIKPRKRRKKDRKPQPAPESTIVTLKPYTPLCQEFTPEEEAKASVAKKAEQQEQPQQKLQNDSVVEPNCCCRYCDPAGSVWDSPLLGSQRSAEWSTLQVSSEIITSPNGHRDIEIKFFSAPAPAPAAPQRPVSVSPPWQ
uniref:Uncharacterized protein n=2 Tax=Lygus hesperus TaxID=30085 RepID=A0A0K8T3F0_LYGHE